MTVPEVLLLFLCHLGLTKVKWITIFLLIRPTGQKLNQKQKFRQPKRVLLQLPCPKCRSPLALLTRFASL